mgnify:CR=1 FL=1
MLETLNNWIISANDWIWTYLLIILLILIGLYFTFKSRFVQFRYFGEMFRLLGQGVSNGKGKNSVSSFQAFCIATASRVGTGNLAGVATAVALGGSGAVFWMWVLALIGSASAFVESTLAQIYKEKGERSFIGGPAFYIGKGLKKKGLALLFAFIIIITFGLVFNSVQANTIAIAFHEIYGTGQLGPAIILTFFTLITIFGGIHRIARVAGIIVPFMAIAYILVALFILFNHMTAIPALIGHIFSNAFGIEQVVGGGLGATIMQGVRRGLFSNEAGMGSAPNAAATATVSHPVKQGLVQMLSVFIDTLLLCTATAMMCMSSGIDPAKELQGAPWVQASLQESLGSFGPIFITVAMVFFAFTTLLGNCFYCDNLLIYIHKKQPGKAFMKGFRLVSALAIFLGAGMEMSLLWDLSDVLMGVMALINIPVILILSGIAVKAIQDYEVQLKQGINPVFKSTDIGLSQKTDFWS